MLAGHYATALVANEKFGIDEGNKINRSTLLYFLVASQLPDLLWVFFHYLGLEPTTPDSVLDMTLKNLTVDMVFSHDLVPSLFWAIILYFVGRGIFKKNSIALTGSLLHLIHIAVDYSAGYPHHLCGANTPSIGFAAYHSVPMIAVALEAAFSIVLLYFFFQGERRKGVVRSTRNSISIIGFFIFSVTFMGFLASNSLRNQFGLEGVDSVLTSTMLNMAATYWGMMAFLFFTVSKTKNTSFSQ